MPRHYLDITKVRAAIEPSKEQVEEHDRLQEEGQAEFEEEAIRLANRLTHEFPKLSDAQRETVLWRRLGWMA